MSAVNHLLTESSKGEEEIFTVLEAQGSCFHCAGCEGCGCQTGMGQLPPVVHSSRTQDGRHREQTNDHLKHIKMMKDDAECTTNKFIKKAVNKGEGYLQ